MRSIAVLVVLTSPFAVSSCARSQKVETAAAKLLVSDEEMKRLGEEVHQQLEKEGVRFLDDPEVTSYVEGIARDIFEVAKKERSGLDWHVHVIDDPKQVNAFATPGGHLYVASGLLAAADTKAEVAGVMAHEVGHVVGRHIERQLVASYGLETLTAMALGKDPRAAAQVAAQLLGQGALLAYGRREENEADAYGVRFASRAGYDPRGLVSFFEKLVKGEGRQPAVFQWLSTHPDTRDRIEHVRRLIQEGNYQGGDVGREEHQRIRARLR